MANAYTIPSAADITDRTGAYHIASVYDAVTGCEVAHFIGGSVSGHWSLPIGVPLCAGCDGIVDATGYCASCE